MRRLKSIATWLRQYFRFRRLFSVADSAEHAGTISRALKRQREVRKEQKSDACE